MNRSPKLSFRVSCASFDGLITTTLQGFGEVEKPTRVLGLQLVVRIYLKR